MSKQRNYRNSSAACYPTSCYTTKYCPYRVHAYFVPFSIGICIFFAIFAGASFADGAYREMVKLTVLTGIGCFLTKYLYSTSRITIFLGADGIRIAYKKRSKTHFVPWEVIKHGYTYTNFKGHQFLLLSDGILDKVKATQLIRKESYSSKAYFSGVLVLHLDPTQDTTELLANIEEKAGIGFIDYCQI